MAKKDKTITLEEQLLGQFSEQINPSDENIGVKWKATVDSPQEMAFYSNAYELLYGGAAGGGKAGYTKSKVSTPDGWKMMGDIQVGDIISDVDGGTSRVLGVYPQGLQPTYEVTFIDGAKTLVSEDHLWNYWKAGGKRTKEKSILVGEYNEVGDLVEIRTEPMSHNRYGYLVCTTKMLKEMVDKANTQKENNKRPYYPLVPLTEPVYYNDNRTDEEKSKWIDPYVLGVLLGDGCLRPSWFSDMSFASIDDEIVERVSKSVRRIQQKGIVYYIHDDNLFRKLSYFKIWGKFSDNKFIPKQYLFSSIEDRFNLAQGLFDTDGYIDKRGHVEYTTISKQLAEDIQHLVRSLGFKTTLTSKNTSYIKRETGERIECSKAYIIYVQGRGTEKLFHLSRKRNRAKPFNGGVSEVGRRVVSVEYVGELECQCIKVDHWSQLYITDDFIVTHNTDLMLGLSLSEKSSHQKAIMFRFSYPEHKDAIDRARAILENTNARWRAGTQMKFDRIPGGKTLEFGSVPTFAAAQKYKGRAHDLKLFDELSEIDEAVYLYLMTWARTTTIGVPVRIVASTNPPSSNKGLWIVRRWAAWLDPTYPNPAEPGELRYFATLDGEDTEITSQIDESGSQGEEFEYITKSNEVELIKPKSRTFIPARIDDNPYWKDTEYKGGLQLLPEPFRSQMLYGDFSLAMKSDPFQVIPTAWLMDAEKRFDNALKSGELSTYRSVEPSYGCDVAEAGADSTTLAKIIHNFILSVEYIDVDESNQMLIPQLQAAVIKEKLGIHHHAPIAIDAIGVGIGLGSHLLKSNIRVIPLKVNKISRARDKTKQFKFADIRTELWWRLRERLDPENNETPLGIAVNRKLRSELTSPHFYKINADTIAVESKKEVRRRLGHSPDLSEAVILALAAQKYVGKNKIRII